MKNNYMKVDHVVFMKYATQVFYFYLKIALKLASIQKSFVLDSFQKLAMYKNSINRIYFCYF